MNEIIKILNEAKAFAKKARQASKTDLKVTCPFSSQPFILQTQNAVYHS